MIKCIDLHSHSYYSDGQYSPTELVKRASGQDIKVFALSDHNVICGVEEAMKAGRRYRIKVIPAIEFYTTYRGKRLHVLGYNINIQDKELKKILNRVQKKHFVCVQERLEKLEKMRFKIDFSLLSKVKSKYIGFGDVVSILMKNPKNKKRVYREIKPKPHLFEVIQYYFSRGKKAHVSDVYIPSPKAIKLIKKIGGIAVLAHPGQQLLWHEDKIVYDLKRLGMGGIEAISPYHTWHTIEHYQKLASDLNLIITGGSDYHGNLFDPGLKFMPIKKQWDYFRVPYSIYINFQKHL